MPDQRDDDKRTVLHVVSYDIARGAERYAQALIHALNSRSSFRHVLATMFEAETKGLDPEICLDVPRGTMRRAGLDPRVVFRLQRALTRMEPAALVAHGGEPAKYAALSRTNVPYAYLLIGSSHPLLRNPVRRAVRKMYLDRAAALVAVSNRLAAEVSGELGHANGRLHVIPNGRDPALYRPRDNAVRPVPRVLFIGHLDEQKRPLLFLDVMRQILDEGIGATAAIVGSGPLLDDVTLDANMVGVEVLGPRDDVPDLLSDSDLLVLTSQPPEGMPGVLIEAGLTGIPVVATDVPGADEIVDDGVTGMLVGVDDVAGLVDAVSSLLRDPQRRLQMGQAARARCLDEFSIDASADRWDEVLTGIAE